MADTPGNRKNSSLKTYSRRVNNNVDEPPSKKRRVEELPAMKSEAPVHKISKSSILNFFKPISAPSSSCASTPLPSSDAAEPTSTPPSSPPPRSPSPVASRPTKKRRLNSRPALQSIENGVVNAPVREEKGKEVSSKYSQMRLDLGQQVYEECSVCHYYYDRSDTTDTKAHDKFHDFHTNQLQPKTEDPKVVLWEETIDQQHHSIRVISRITSAGLKERFINAFSSTYQDMGGEAIDEAKVWSEIKNPHHPLDERKVPRYKGYMYLIDRRPVSILLVERIKSAIFFPFKESLDEERVSGRALDNCKMSVDRIWTRTENRRKGFATRLVDTARGDFIKGLVVKKGDVAFTSTTRDGGGFAKRYCEGLWEGAEYLMTLS